jgi:hypothetical protein
MRLPALWAGRPLPPGRLLVLISVRGWVEPRDTVRLEGSGQLKNPMTSSGIEPATFRLVAYWPQLSHWYTSILTPSWKNCVSFAWCHAVIACMAAKSGLNLRPANLSSNGPIKWQSLEPRQGLYMYDEEPPKQTPATTASLTKKFDLCCLATHDVSWPPDQGMELCGFIHNTSAECVGGIMLYHCIRNGKGFNFRNV